MRLDWDRMKVLSPRPRQATCILLSVDLCSATVCRAVLRRFSCALSVSFGLGLGMDLLVLVFGPPLGAGDPGDPDPPSSAFD